MDSGVDPPVRGSGLVGYGERGTDVEEAKLPAPPTQARGVDKRDRLYAAAIARFAADGVAATHIEDVIADAQVSWATFFRYFPRKGDVLIEHAARHFREHVRTAAHEGIRDGRLAIRTVIERTFTALLEPTGASAELHNAALLEVFAHPARFASLIDEGHPQPLVGIVAELLTEADARGELRPGLDPGAAALTLVAGTLFPAVQAAALGANPTGPMTLALDILWVGLGR